MKVKELRDWERLTLQVLTFIVPLVFILPLVTASGYFFPFIVPRNMAFRIIVGVCLALFIMLFIARPRAYLPRKSYVLYALFSLVGILTLSSFINGDFLYSFWSTYERMEGLLNLYFVLAFIIVLIGVYRTKEDWLKLIRFTVLVSIPVAFIGWSQHVGADFLLASSGGERVSSTLGNATYLAAYALFHIFFSLYLLYKVKSDRFTFEFAFLGALDIVLIITEGRFGTLNAIFQHATLAMFFILPQLCILGARYLKSEAYREHATKIYFSLVILINFAVLFNTQTRGALVGLLIGLGLMFIGIAVLQKGRPRLKKAAIGGLVFMIVAMSALVNFKDTEFVRGNKPLSRVASISLDDTTARTRLFNWEAAYLGLKEKPVLGWGEERYHLVFNEHFPEQIYRHSGSRIWFDRPHNVVIQYFVSGGILGGIAYLSIFVFSVLALFAYWKRTGDLSTFMLFSALLVGYTVQNAFVFDSLNTYILFALVIAFIVSQTSKDHSEELPRALVKRPPLIAGLVVLLAAYSVTVPQAQANKYYITTFAGLNQAVAVGEITDAIADIEEAIEHQYFGRYELRQNYADTVRGFLNSSTITDEQKRELVESAEKLMLRSIEEQPDNVRHHAFLGGLYVESQRLIPENAVKNIELSTEAIELSPTRTHLYYALGRSYLVTGDAEKSLDSFRTALELSPKVSDAHLNYLAALVTTRNFDEADTHLEVMREALDRELSGLEYIRIASMYVSIEDTSKALSLLEMGASLYPENIELLQQMIPIHLGNNDTAAALSVAERIVAINPELADQLEAFKQSLQSDGLIIE